MTRTVSNIGKIKVNTPIILNSVLSLFSRAMGFDAKSANNAESGKRLALALLASVFVHGALISGIGIAPTPRAAAQNNLRASIIPLSVANAVRIDQAQSVEAARELNTSRDISPRDARQSTDRRNDLAQDPDRKLETTPGIAAELPIYYRNDEVDVRATPREVGSSSTNGGNLMLGRIIKVKVRLFIGDTGQVERYEIMESEGLTDSVSLDDLSDIPFHPAQRKGRSVRSQKIVELRFAP